MAGYFGTDGIRGRAGEGKLSEAAVERLAVAIGSYFGAGSSAIIGRDTRESGNMIFDALSRGFRRQGVDVTSIGVLPTPATAMMVPHLDADFGLMITASHNPWQDNGIKLFGADGQKISDADQDAIEARIEQVMAADLPDAERRGELNDPADLEDVYVKALVKAFRSAGGADLSGISIVADCANGAAYRVFPAALRALGADPIVIGGSPDGRNINAACGSTHPEALAAEVLSRNADIGIALDGDADRLIVVDHLGQEIDGDQIIARLATDYHKAGQLKGGAVVSTVMSNMGLERYLNTLNVALERTPVGDRHVAARMKEIGANLGGEPSGHLLMTDYGAVGDGSLAALMVLAGLQKSGQSSADYLSVFDPLPQQLKNVRYSGRSPMESEVVQAAIRDADAALGERGRVLVRASGTEPKIRVMVEAEEPALVSETVDNLCAIIASLAD